MIFSAWSIERILAGEKTQTRRLVQPGDVLVEQTVYNRRGHVRWRIGRSYVIQPGRGLHGIGHHIRINNIFREHLQDITQAAALAEGIRGSTNPIVTFAQIWDSIYRQSGKRWKDNPEVWVLEFELR